VSIAALDVLKSPEKLPEKSVYVILGDDLFLRAETIASIELLVFPGDSDSIGLTRKSGDSVALSDVFDELSTPSFFAPRRLVVLDPADGFVTKHREKLESYADKPASGGVLVLAVKQMPATTRLYKILEKSGGKGVVIDARTPKPAEAVAWVMDRALAHQAKIERDAANLLVDMVGPEAGVLDQELEKLAIATHDGKVSRISREDVARYVHAGQAESVWRMIERATKGDARRALEDLDSLLSAGEAPIALLAAISSHLRKLHHAGWLRQQRVGDRDAMKQAGVFPNGIDDAIAQHKHLGFTRVMALPALMLEADLGMKGWSELPPRAIMERLIIRLAQPRKD
jgi:DNA polymerase-3 subunit delta